MKKIFFNSKDGIKLCGVWHLPVKKTSKAIIFAHGITVDKDESNNSYVKLADFLCKAGYACFRFDFRGAGESGGKSEDITIKGELEDFDAALNLIKKDYSSIGVLGTSFGCSIVTLYAAGNQPEIKCICLCSPVLNFDHTFLHPTLPWIKNSVGHIRKDFAEKGWSQLGSRKMKVGAQLFKEMETLFPYEEIKKIKLPLTIIHGTADTHVPYVDSQKYIKGVGKLITIKDGKHGMGNGEEEMMQIFKEVKNFFKNNL